MNNKLRFRLIRLIIGNWNPIRWFLYRQFFKQLPHHKLKSLTSDSPFLKIPKEKWINESENAFVVKDIRPRAPVHLLVIPKVRIYTVMDASPQLMGEMIQLAKETASQFGIVENGFRLIINTNVHGVQTVYHLHIHIIGGRQLPVPLI
jgi:histidine triad (HIT) family protein